MHLALWPVPVSELFRELWILQTVGRSTCSGDHPVARPLPIEDNIENKRRHTAMPRGGFDPMIPLFEQANIFRAVDHTITMIGCNNVIYYY